jgi:hypothetical protein
MTAQSMKFVLRPQAVAELAAGEAMAGTLDDAAQKLAAEAKEIALVEAYDTGEYANALEAVPSEIDEHGHQIASVQADVPHAAAVEWGGLNRPGVHVLTRAAQAVGLHIKSKRTRKRR